MTRGSSTLCQCLRVVATHSSQLISCWLRKCQHFPRYHQNTAIDGEANGTLWPAPADDGRRYDKHEEARRKHRKPMEITQTTQRAMSLQTFCCWHLRNTSEIELRVCNRMSSHKKKCVSIDELNSLGQKCDAVMLRDSRHEKVSTGKRVSKLQCHRIMAYLFLG